MQRSIIPVFSLSLVIIALIAASCDVSNIRNINALPADGDTQPVEPVEDGDITEEDRDLWQDAELPAESDPDTIEIPDTAEEDGDQWWDEEIPAESDPDIIEIPESTEEDGDQWWDEEIPAESEPDIIEELDDTDAVDGPELPPLLDLPALQPVPLPDENTHATYLTSVTLSDNSIIVVYRWHDIYQWAHSSTDRTQWNTRNLALPDEVIQHIKPQVSPPAVITNDGQGGLNIQPLEPDAWEFRVRQQIYYQAWVDAQDVVHIPIMAYAYVADPQPDNLCNSYQPLLDLRINPETMEMTASLLHDFATEDNLYPDEDDRCPNQIYRSDYRYIHFIPHADGCNEALWVWNAYPSAGHGMVPKLMHSVSCNGSSWEQWKTVYAVGDLPGPADDGSSFENLVPVYDRNNTITRDLIVSVKPDRFMLTHVGIHVEAGNMRQRLISYNVNEEGNYAPEVLGAYRFEDDRIQWVTATKRDTGEYSHLSDVVFQSLTPDTWTPDEVHFTHTIPPYIYPDYDEGSSRYTFEGHVAASETSRRIFIRRLDYEVDHEVYRFLEYGHTFNDGQHEISLLEGRQPDYFDTEMGAAIEHHYFPNKNTPQVDIIAQMRQQPFNPYNIHNHLDSGLSFLNICFYKENNEGVRVMHTSPIHDIRYEWDVRYTEWLDAGENSLPLMVMGGTYFATFDPAAPQDAIALHPPGTVGRAQPMPAFDRSSALETQYEQVVSISIDPQDRSLQSRELIPPGPYFGSGWELMCPCIAVSSAKNISLLSCKDRNGSTDLPEYKILRCDDESCEEPFEISIPFENQYLEYAPELYYAGDQLRMSCIQMDNPYTNRPINLYTFSSDDNGDSWQEAGTDLLGYDPYVSVADWVPVANGEQIAGMAVICNADDTNPDGCHLSAFTLTPGQEVVEYFDARYRVDPRLTDFQIDIDWAGGTIAALWRIDDTMEVTLPDYALPHPDPRMLHSIVFDTNTGEFSIEGLAAIPVIWQSDIANTLEHNRLWYRDGTLCMSIDDILLKPDVYGPSYQIGIGIPLWGCSRPEW